jgi:hypothetical protein
MKSTLTLAAILLAYQVPLPRPRPVEAPRPPHAIQLDRLVPHGPFDWNTDLHKCHWKMMVSSDCYWRL